LLKPPVILLPELYTIFGSETCFLRVEVWFAIAAAFSSVRRSSDEP
jgi:hypothetical protein